MTSDINYRFVLPKVIKSLTSQHSVQSEWVADGKLLRSNVGRYKVKPEPKSQLYLLPFISFSPAFIQFEVLLILF